MTNTRNKLKVETHYDYELNEDEITKNNEITSY
jgi:hypothetical protein